MLDQIEIDSDELLLTYTNDGEEYDKHLALARVADSVAWTLQAERLARAYARQFREGNYFPVQTVLVFALKLADYYEEHLTEL